MEFESAIQETVAREIPEREVPERNSSLHASIRDGVSYAVMLGCAETYFSAFGIFLRAGTLQVGLLASLPQLFAAIVQWASALRMDRFTSRRAVVIAGGVAQAVSLVPIALLPFIFEKGNTPVVFLILLALVYHGGNGATIPVWNSLIGDLVPPDIRGRFFGHRNMLTGMATFASLLLAGGVLHGFDYAGIPALGFLICFSAAFIARMNSVRWLTRYDDPAFRILPEQVFTFREFLRRSPQSNFAKFVFFIGAINFGVAFSAPYFALYMLRDLQFSYVEYTVVSATAMITQFLTFRYWGGLSDRFGNKKILNVCGWGVAVLPILWLFSAKIGYLLVIQTFGGFVWSGFSLASANFLFDAVTPPKRARCVAYLGLVNGCLLFLGSLAGGYAAIHLPKTFYIGSWTWTPPFILPVIFVISGLIRVAASGMMLRKFKEVRPVEPIGHKALIYKISHVKPIVDLTFGVFTGLFRGHLNGENGKKERESSTQFP